VTRNYQPAVSKEAVVAEYTLSAQASDEFAKVKWGSQASMDNRLRLAASLVDWTRIKSWLDVGCGTGRFFELVDVSDVKVETRVGIDITAAMITEARRKKYALPPRFAVADLSDLDGAFGRFDLVSLIGVLQQCGVSPAVALRHSASVLAPGGQLILTTKHLGWDEFTSGRLQPEEGHSWFEQRELSEAAAGAGLQVLRTGGLLPREGRLVPADQSHSIFLLATKPS